MERGRPRKRDDRTQRLVPMNSWHELRVVWHRLVDKELSLSGTRERRSIVSETYAVSELRVHVHSG